MPVKQHKATTKKVEAQPAHSATKSKVKQVKIKHHHKKAYRKRHFGGLTIFILLGLFLLVFAVQYRTNLNTGVQNARDLIASLFNTNPQNIQTVNSTFGFQFNYDIHKYYASGIDANTGDLFLGPELSTRRAYEVVRLSKTSTNDTAGQGSLTIQYYDNQAVPGSDLQKLQDTLIPNISGQASSSLNKKSSETVTIGGTQFLKTQWLYKSSNSVTANLNLGFTTYIGIVNGHPLTIKSNDGLGSSKPSFEEVINTMVFGARTQAAIKTTPQIAAKESENRSLIDSLLFSKVAAASTTVAPTTAEKISSTYGPAVVKIYNVYCMDINLDGKPYLRDACDALTGSGFFVSSDGYVATNGHVATSNIKDIVIGDAINTAAAGNAKYLDMLIGMAGIQKADIAGKSELDALDYIVDKLYGISDTHFAATNNVSNLLVDLNQKEPDPTELIKLTKERKEYSEQDSIKRAKLIAADYRVWDGIASWKASDVALIKVDGENYPVGKLGSIDGLSQGASISILGYPGAATDNGLVDSTQSTVTLTSGQVSSIKNSAGSNKKLIETSTTIGHGNSGGPVFTDDGNIVGIATYTIDGSGKGDGTYNYIRDIKDFTDLVSKSAVSLNTKSDTQSEWEKGLDAFYTAHYSKSLKNFQKVKELYPSHPKVAELIASAETNIKNGKDVKDFPLVLVLVGAFVAVGGIVTFVIVIIRHKKAHNAYAHHVATGAMQPLSPGMPAQYVPVPQTPGYPAAPMQVQQPQPQVVPQPQTIQPTAYTPQVVQPQTPPNQQPPNNPPIG